MDRKGTGHAHEMLLALFVLVLFLTFYARDISIAIPPMMIILGGVMILGGMAIREPLVITGGIVMLAVALMYSEAV